MKNIIAVVKEANRTFDVYMDTDSYELSTAWGTCEEQIADKAPEDAKAAFDAVRTAFGDKAALVATCTEEQSSMGFAYYDVSAIPASQLSDETLCAVIDGADDWTLVEDYCTALERRADIEYDADSDDYEAHIQACMDKLLGKKED